MAILSLVFAFLINIVGVILGFIALNQIKRTGEKGRGLAIAGIVIGALSLLASILFFAFLFAGIGNEIAKSSASHSSAVAASSSASASAQATNEMSKEASSAADEASANASTAAASAALDPASPYCVALDEFLVASDNIQKDVTTLESYMASLTNVRDNAPSEEMRTALTNAIEAAKVGDVDTFESSLNSVTWDLGLDAVNCGIE
ncbi:DUF4190 domain-containing protein [Rothia sp. 88186D007BW]